MQKFVQKSASEHNRPSAEQALQGPRVPLIFILENIRSGINVGSILRTADAFACAEVAMCGYTPTPPHREILKSSLGAETSVPWKAVAHLPEYLSTLRTEGYRIAAVEQTSNAVALTDYVLSLSAKPNPTAVILGNEVRGLSTDTLSLVDLVIEIPQYGAKQSLNVSVAAGIVAWALSHPNRS